MFGRRRKVEARSYDHDRLEPVIRKSICTGEEEAGFLDRETEHFTSMVLIRTARDLDDFKAEWGISGDLRTIY